MEDSENGIKRERERAIESNCSILFEVTVTELTRNNFTHNVIYMMYGIYVALVTQPI